MASDGAIDVVDVVLLAGCGSFLSRSVPMSQVLLLACESTGIVPDYGSRITVALLFLD